jgi:hypothetical protein
MSTHSIATSVPPIVVSLHLISYTVHVMLVLLLCNANAMHHNVTAPSDQILVCMSFRQMGIS